MANQYMESMTETEQLDDQTNVDVVAYDDELLDPSLFENVAVADDSFIASNTDDSVLPFPQSQEFQTTDSSSPQSGNLSTQPGSVQTAQNNAEVARLTAELARVTNSNQSLTQKAELAELAKVEQTITADTAKYMRSLMTQGLDQGSASIAAQQYKAARVNEVEAKTALAIGREEMQGKINAAFYYGKQYHVDPQSLLQYNSPQEMEANAAHNKRVTELESTVKKLQKQASPSNQTFAGTSSTPAAVPSQRMALLDRYIENPDSFSAEQVAQLFPNG